MYLSAMLDFIEYTMGYIRAQHTWEDFATIFVATMLCLTSQDKNHINALV
jgi:hypothetical protein